MQPSRPSRDELRRAEIFRALSDAECDALTVCLSVRTCVPGDVLFKQGDPGTTMVVVAEGILAASVRRADGAQEEINRMGPGETIGEMSLLDPAPRSATVTAATHAVVFELSDDALRTLRRQAPGAASAVVAGVIRDVTRRLRRIDKLIEVELQRRGTGGGGGATRRTEP